MNCQGIDARNWPDFRGLQGWENVHALTGGWGLRDPLEKWIEMVKPREAETLAESIYISTWSKPWWFDDYFNNRWLDPTWSLHIVAPGFEEVIQSYPEIIEGALRLFDLSKWVNNVQGMGQLWVMTSDRDFLSTFGSGCRNHAVRDMVLRLHPSVWIPALGWGVWCLAAGTSERRSMQHRKNTQRQHAATNSVLPLTCDLSTKVSSKRKGREKKRHPQLVPSWSLLNSQVPFPSHDRPLPVRCAQGPVLSEF